MQNKSLILFLCLSASIAAGGFLVRNTGDEASWPLPGGARNGIHRTTDLDALPGPLIQTDDLYLMARGRWLGEYLNGLFETYRDPDAHLNPNPKVIIHHQPFTSGPWVAKLNRQQAERRRRMESQTLESHLLVELAEVPCERLLQFLVFSGYQSQIEGIGEFERKLYFPPLASVPPELDAGLTVASHQFICHERTRRPEILAQPTGVYYLFDAHRFGDTYLLRFDLLGNTSGENYATVRMSAGHYLVTPCDVGTRLYFVAFYSGQTAPALFDGFVKNLTADFLLKLGEKVRSLAPGWAVPREAREWVKTAFSASFARG